MPAASGKASPLDSSIAATVSRAISFRERISPAAADRPEVTASTSSRSSRYLVGTYSLIPAFPPASRTRSAAVNDDDSGTEEADEEPENSAGSNAAICYLSASRLTMTGSPSLPSASTPRASAAQFE